MRIILILALFLAIPGFADGNLPIYRFVKATGFYQKGTSLPPAIEATFKVRCYQKFLSVVRNEVSDPLSKKVTIAIGGLVEEDPRIACSGETTVNVPAGHGYSGREFEVVAIQN